MLATIFLILALVSFLLVAVNANPLPRINLLGLGLSFWVLALLVGNVSVNLH